MDCIRDGIAEYSPRPSKPWDSRRIAHLYNRMGFGANHQEITAALAISPSDLIDQIVDNAITLPLAPEPYWSEWTRSPVNDYAEGEAMGTSFTNQANTHRREWTVQLFNSMLINGFRDKLILFWHNHFVTQFSTYSCSSYLHKYYKVLGEYSLGNFRDFAYEIGKTPAMVKFLNADQSTKYHPNENYARELLELFTMGVDNGYTQTDIVEISKALTGFQARGCRDTEFRPDYFDTEDKTVFGQTGPWNYDDVHDLIFEYRPNNVAEYICKKIYRYFIISITPPECELGEEITIDCETISLQLNPSIVVTNQDSTETIGIENDYWLYECKIEGNNGTDGEWIPVEEVVLNPSTNYSISMRAVQMTNDSIPIFHGNNVNMCFDNITTPALNSISVTIEEMC
ncbi:MAG: DUF1800 family protein, partial [Chitinophagales bacterium]